MTFVSTVTIQPETGVFQPTSFERLVQQEVQVPGLDPAFRHIVTAAEVTEDGTSATLTIVTTTPHTLDLARYISVLLDVPKATIEAYDLDGNHLASTALDAPLVVGQNVLVQGASWTVQEVSWPNRDPETGAVPVMSTIGAPPLLDVQRATLIPGELPPAVQPA